MRIRTVGTVLLLITGALAISGSQAQTTGAKSGTAPQQPVSPREALIARAKSLELDSPYVPPPGDPLEHHTAGYAKIMCSAFFITGLDPEFAAENVGYFTSPYPERAKVGKPVIDRSAKTVSVTLPNGVTRTAKYLGDQGCVTLPTGKSSVNFTPVAVKSQLPDPSTQPWPMGDAPARDAPPAELDTAKVRQAVDAAFDPAEGMTAAFVVTWRGRLVGERYGEAITAHTPLESWSMGKSVTATLMGILIKQGVYDLWQRAPIPEWQGEGDARAKIRVADLLRMSSGLRIKAPQDPDYDPLGTYPDHLYLYTGGVDSFHYAATRPLQWPAGMVGRYHNTDPVLINYLIRLAVEKRGEEYLSFPRRALFDRLGIRTMVIETDPFGNFLTQGYDFASGRDWARLGNLYLQDGMWNGERILPEGYAKFVATVAPAWEADKRPVYGGFFWINGDGTFPVPKEAYYMSGAGGQTTLIVPSHDLVVVRLGHYKGSTPGTQSLGKALALLMEAVPRRSGGH
jgi:CubicO group peptidase (beta-lactamase class C family)